MLARVAALPKLAQETKHMGIVVEKAQCYPIL